MHEYNEDMVYLHLHIYIYVCSTYSERDIPFNFLLCQPSGIAKKKKYIYTNYNFYSKFYVLIENSNIVYMLNIYI